MRPSSSRSGMRLSAAAAAAAACASLTSLVVVVYVTQFHSKWTMSFLFSALVFGVGVNSARFCVASFKSSMSSNEF